MNINELEAVIEAILFSMGESVSIKKLSETIETDDETTKKILHQMMDRYNSEVRGITMIEIEGNYQLCTKKEYYDYVKRATQKVVKFELTEVLLETLSIIAYKQPITKALIESIRGVKSDHAVNRLVEYGLAEEKGRLDSPGRPVLFGTTEAFLRNFGLSNTEDLPEIDMTQIENIKHEIEEEMQLSFDELEAAHEEMLALQVSNEDINEDVNEDETSAPKVNGDELKVDALSRQEEKSSGEIEKKHKDSDEINE